MDSWPHAPSHRITAGGTYIVTAGTLGKRQVFKSDPELTFLRDGLLDIATERGWLLDAWAVFSNHYHFVGHAPQSRDSVRQLVSALHEKTAKWLKQTGVWHNYWDTRLTFQRSYLARLHYVHTNPVKHGLVNVASDYPWCSAAWFEQTARPAEVRTVYSFRIDKVSVYDEFD